MSKLFDDIKRAARLRRQVEQAPQKADAGSDATPGRSAGIARRGRPQEDSPLLRALSRGSQSDAAGSPSSPEETVPASPEIDSTPAGVEAGVETSAPTAVIQARAQADREAALASVRAARSEALAQPLPPPGAQTAKPLRARSWWAAVAASAAAALVLGMVIGERMHQEPIASVALQTRAPVSTTIEPGLRMDADVEAFGERVLTHVKQPRRAALPPNVK